MEELVFETTVNRKIISCFGSSKIIHKIWSDAWYYSYGLLPSVFMRKYKMIYETVHRPNNEIISKLKRICYNFKKSYKQTKDEYFNLNQPSIEYLINESKINQSIALRLWATTEGSIMNSNHHFYISHFKE